MDVLSWGYRVPFVSVPPLSPVPIPLPSYSPMSIKEKALQGEIESLISKRAVEPAPLSPRFYSRLFVVQKASGAWRPRAYAFPPFALVREVINKVVLSRNLLLTLVAPWWPQKEGFLDLQSLTIAAPVSLPMCRDLLHQPHFHRLHLRIHVLRLHTWRLSSGSHEN